MDKLTVGSLFAGIGGFDLGLERTGGFEVVWQCEIDPYCQRVLAKHWPHVKRHGDIRELTDVQRVDVLCGGFPCQDISNAGKRAGIDGERSGLWSEYVRVIRLVRPQYVLVENVAALLDEGMATVLGSLAECGYDAEWRIVRASDFGAPHERERLFLLAYPNEGNGKAWMGTVANRTPPIFAGSDCERFPVWLQAASSFAGMDDGVRGRFYESRVGGLGNSILPQIATWIGQRILAHRRRG